MRVGIYNRWLPTLGGGEKYSLKVAQCLSREHVVDYISHTPMAQELIANRLYLDLTAVNFVPLPECTVAALAPRTAQYDLFINASQGDFIPPHAKCNVLIVYFPVPLRAGRMAQLRQSVARSLRQWLLTPTFAHGFYQRLFGQLWPDWDIRLQNLPDPHLDHARIVQSYDAIWTISEFSRGWIKKYWQRDALVLSPPISVNELGARPKRNWILSVGRFFAGSHNKKHLVMIEAFKRMVRHGLHDWELHLAGGTMTGAAHAAYLRAIRNAARGYPIFIHTDVTFEQLRSLYVESPIYWHASGYGENEQRDPIKLEHFGITTVEAMAAYCVPVVIAKGGQTEVIRHGHNGFLWNDVGELIALTERLIRDPVLRWSMARTAFANSREFDEAHFHACLTKYLQPLNLA